MTQFYERHSVAPVEETLALIRQHEADRSVKRVDVNGLSVGVKSLRLRTFLHKGTTCVSCGLRASFFALERDRASAARNEPFHLNLYGVRDESEVLFTHDHILARGLEGKNNLGNTQTMCFPCNQAKSVVEAKLMS